MHSHWLLWLWHMDNLHILFNSHKFFAFFVRIIQASLYAVYVFLHFVHICMFCACNLMSTNIRRFDRFWRSDHRLQVYPMGEPYLYFAKFIDLLSGVWQLELPWDQGCVKIYCTKQSIVWDYCTIFPENHDVNILYNLSRIVLAFYCVGECKNLHIFLGSYTLYQYLCMYTRNRIEVSRFTIIRHFCLRWCQEIWNKHFTRWTQIESQIFIRLYW